MDFHEPSLLPTHWLGKPYYSLDAFCQRNFGEKIYKIALDAGLSCPNRDGTCGTRGCIFCSQGGSGDFAVKSTSYTPTGQKQKVSIGDQLDTGKKLFHQKQFGQRFIAYFQAYSNTYGSLTFLEQIYREALSEPSVAGISIATRPDCLPETLFPLFYSLKKEFPSKFIWVELGLQTIHEDTAIYIRRGYPLSCFQDAVFRLVEADIPVIVHVILGLPHENQDMILETIEYLNNMPIHGIKLQLLHVLCHTDLADEYTKQQFQVLTMEEYLSLLISCLEHLSPNTVVHRLTGDGPKDLLIAPLWSQNKRAFLNKLHQQMKEQNSWQGKRYPLT